MWRNQSKQPRSTNSQERKQKTKRESGAPLIDVVFALVLPTKFEKTGLQANREKNNKFSSSSSLTVVISHFSRTLKNLQPSTSKAKKEYRREEKMQQWQQPW